VSERAGAGIRRRPGVELLLTAYDLRSIFKSDAGGPPRRRKTTLAILAAADAQEPVIFDLTAEVFDLLAALGQWTDRAAFGDPDAAALVAGLVDAGLVELRE
jgi:hypothetical protein